MDNDLISRQVAIELKSEFLNPNVNRETEEQTAIDRTYARGWNSCNTHWIDEISELPSAHPERKKGKWIYKNDLKQYFCSECGFPSLTYDDVYIYGMDLPNYCEDCGADMRGGQDE